MKSVRFGLRSSAKVAHRPTRERRRTAGHRGRWLPRRCPSKRGRPRQVRAREGRQSLDRRCCASGSPTPPAPRARRRKGSRLRTSAAGSAGRRSETGTPAQSRGPRRRGAAARSPRAGPSRLGRAVKFMWLVRHAVIDLRGCATPLRRSPRLRRTRHSLPGDGVRSRPTRLHARNISLS